MRRILIALVVLGVAATIASAENSIGFYGSMWKPSDLDRVWGGGAKIQMELAPSVYIEARGTYFPRAKDEDDDVDEVKIDIIPIEGLGILKLPVDEAFTPYAGGGIGYYMFRTAEEPDNVSIEVENKFGFFVVGGFEIGLGEAVKLFAEGKYTFLDNVTVKAESGGVTAEDDDGKLSGFGGNVGMLLLW